jgi:hypothetical protein
MSPIRARFAEAENGVRLDRIEERAGLVDRENRRLLETYFGPRTELAGFT